jgi:hypothetical protein
LIKLKEGFEGTKEYMYSISMHIENKFDGLINGAQMLTALDNQTQPISSSNTVPLSKNRKDPHSLYLYIKKEYLKKE